MRTTNTNKYLAVRTKLKLNQSDFWRRIGVTQSGGSRYETGRNPGKPVQMLFALTYGSPAEKAKVQKQLAG